MTARLITAPALGPWAPAWDDLVAARRIPSPFLRRWWLDAAGDDPLLLLVVDGEELVGGLALDRDRIAGLTRYRVLGAGPLCPDQLDLVAAAGREDEVVGLVSGWFAGRTCLVDLEGLVPDPLASRLWPDAPLEQVEGNPWSELPHGDYLASRSKNARKRIRRAERDLGALGARVVRRDPAGPDVVAAALEDIARLHGDRPDRADFVAALPRLRPVLEAAAARGELRVDAVEHDGATVVVLLCFPVAGRLSVYHFGRSMAPEHDGASLLLQASVFADAASAGLTEVDFLRGDEAYKAAFADHVRPVLRLTVAQGARARALLGARRAARSVVRRARASRSGGVAPVSG